MICKISLICSMIGATNAIVVAITKNTINLFDIDPKIPDYLPTTDSILLSIHHMITKHQEGSNDSAMKDSAMKDSAMKDSAMKDSAMKEGNDCVMEGSNSNIMEAVDNKNMAMEATENKNVAMEATDNAPKGTRVRAKEVLREIVFLTNKGLRREEIMSPELFWMTLSAVNLHRLKTPHLILFIRNVITSVLTKDAFPKEMLNYFSAKPVFTTDPWILRWLLCQFLTSRKIFWRRVNKKLIVFMTTSQPTELIELYQYPEIKIEDLKNNLGFEEVEVYNHCDHKENRAMDDHSRTIISILLGMIPNIKISMPGSFWAALYEGSDNKSINCNVPDNKSIICNVSDNKSTICKLLENRNSLIGITSLSGWSELLDNEKILNNDNHDSLNRVKYLDIEFLEVKDQSNGRNCHHRAIGAGTDVLNSRFNKNTTAFNNGRFNNDRFNNSRFNNSGFNNGRFNRPQRMNVMNVMPSAIRQGKIAKGRTLALKNKAQYYQQSTQNTNDLINLIKNTKPTRIRLDIRHMSCSSWDRIFNALDGNQSDGYDQDGNNQTGNNNIINNQIHNHPPQRTVIERLSPQRTVIERLSPQRTVIERLSPQRTVIERLSVWDSHGHLDQMSFLKLKKFDVRSFSLTQNEKYKIPWIFRSLKSLSTLKSLSLWIDYEDFEAAHEIKELPIETLVLTNGSWESVKGERESERGREGESDREMESEKKESDREMESEKKESDREMESEKNGEKDGNWESEKNSNGKGDKNGKRSSNRISKRNSNWKSKKKFLKIILKSRTLRTLVLCAGDGWKESDENKEGDERAIEKCAKKVRKIISRLQNETVTKVVCYKNGRIQIDQL